MILFKTFNWLAVKLFCVFSKNYDIFLINIVVKYKIKKDGCTICREKGSGDGVRKGLIWMVPNKLIRLGTPQYL